MFNSRYVQWFSSNHKVIDALEADLNYILGKHQPAVIRPGCLTDYMQYMSKRVYMMKLLGGLIVSVPRFLRVRNSDKTGFSISCLKASGKTLQEVL